MVWARTKLVIQDDLLRPSNVITLSYKGKNPERFYREVPKLAAAVFRVRESEIQEKKFSWSEGDPVKFKVSWEIDKELDGLSYYHILIDLKGESSKGFGKVSISIEGALRTEYPQDTVWQKSVIYEMLRIVWHKTFYHGKRSEYLEEGRRLMAIFVEELKKLMGGENGG